MKLSFLVTVHNEDSDLEILLDQLNEYLSSNPEDEIIILDDYSDNPKTIQIIDKYKDSVKVVKHKLDVNGGGFGEHKQFGNEQCSGDFIFQCDADEYFSDDLLYGLKDLIQSNPQVDLFLVPRINIIRGLTEERAKPWGWEISKISGISNTKIFKTTDEEYMFLSKYNFITDEEAVNSIEIKVGYDYPIINWKSGDYQYRFYRNTPEIKWERALHELIVGAKVVTQIPREPALALIHDKSIDRQEKQNRFYINNFSKEMNVRK